MRTLGGWLLGGIVLIPMGLYILWVGLETVDRWSRMSTMEQTVTLGISFGLPLVGFGLGKVLEVLTQIRDEVRLLRQSLEHRRS